MNAVETPALTPELNKLIYHINKVVIIAYKESTDLLEKALINEGFQCDVIRQVHRAEFEGYSPSYLCLLNHRKAWEQASHEGNLTLIVEADFVPVLGLGQLPVPFNPKREDTGVAWLYTCAPQIYSVSEEGHAQGFSASTVAYLVTPQSAQYLIELAEGIKENFGPKSYSSWDSTVEQFLRERQLKSYVPFRNYGEHGGKPNSEHRKNGLSSTHRADVLYGKLAFMPLYAVTQSDLFWARLQARCKGIARLAMGKFLRFQLMSRSSVPLRLLSFAVIRQFTLRL